MGLTRFRKPGRLQSSASGESVLDTLSDALTATELAAGSVATSEILDGTILDADVSASAAIALSKLAALTSAQIIVGSAGNVPTAVAMSGDATISNAGAVTIANGVVTSAKLSELTIQYATVTLTNAQCLALRATPIQMVGAPGANKRIQFLGATLNCDATAGVYTETADNLAFKFTNGSGVAVSQTIECTGFIDQAGAKQHTNAQPAIDAITAETGCVNQALVLHNTGDGEWGGGNAANTLKVTIAYRVIGTI